MVPMEVSGKKIEKLDYEGKDEVMICDDDVMALS